MTEAWRNFKPGDRLVIARPIGELEKQMMKEHPGLVFRFLSYSKPHGYATCEEPTHGAFFNFHPEAMEHEKC